MNRAPLPHSQRHSRQHPAYAPIHSHAKTGIKQEKAPAYGAAPSLHQENLRQENVKFIPPWAECKTILQAGHALKILPFEAAQKRGEKITFTSATWRSAHQLFLNLQQGNRYTIVDETLYAYALACYPRRAGLLAKGRRRLFKLCA